MQNGKMVKIYVGPKRKRWVVHKDVICERSDYFRKAFTGSWKEAEKSRIYLHEDDPKVFGHFIDWIYGKSLACYKQHENPADIDYGHVKEWCALYVFADKISLQELAVEALEQYKICSEGTLPCTEEIQYIYENTPESSALREHAVNALVVKFYGRGPDDFDFWADAIACRPEFTRDIAKALKAHVRVATTKECEFDNCSVHTKAPRATRGQRKW